MTFKIRKVFFISTLLIIPFIALAQWDDCPHGKTDGDCEYPGECGLYTDTNKDSICDHSQDQPVVDTTNKDGNSIDDTASKKARLSTNSNKNIENNDESTVKSISQVEHKKQYPFLDIVVVLSIFYAVTYLLAKRRTIKMTSHKKIWNVLLTVSFLALAVTSVLLIVQINSGKIFSLGFDIMYWHVITGIIMMVITLFHMGWHWRYYKNLFK